VTSGKIAFIRLILDHFLARAEALGFDLNDLIIVNQKSD